MKVVAVFLMVGVFLPTWGMLEIWFPWQDDLLLAGIGLVVSVFCLGLILCLSFLVSNRQEEIK